MDLIESVWVWVSCLNPTYDYSINEIKNLTGLDFFSEIPDEIEEVIEGYKNYQPISGVASLY
jgi:hypothetical protein